MCAHSVDQRENSSDEGSTGRFRRWVRFIPSHPFNGSQEWQNRVSEFALAREAGFEVPPAVCTHDPATAISFIEREGEPVLLREFATPPFLMPPRPVTATYVRAAAKLLRSAPCTFQKYIDKDYEVRAVVVGDRIFSVKIESQASPVARFDWRVHDHARVRRERTRLPRRIELSMLRLMKMLELNWGSFDIIKGKDRRFYFLEVNRPGSCFWLLPFVGLDVSREIVKYIKRVLSKSLHDTA